MADGDGGPPSTTFTQEQLDEHTAGLKAKRDELLANERKLKDRLAALEKDFDGIDPAEVRELLKARADEEAKRQKAQGDWEAREKQLHEQYGKKVSELEAGRQGLSEALHNAVAVRDVRGAIAERKANPRALEPHVLPFVRTVEEDGQFVARVVDAKGQVRISGTKGDPMTIVELLDELSQDDALKPLFPSNGASGSGARTSVTTAGGAKVIAAGDGAAFFDNLEGVAKGDVKVA